MKKILTALLCATLTLSTVTTSFAFNEGEIEGYNSAGQTEVTAYAYSTFNVSIPAKIDISNMGGAEIAVTDADIDSGYQVQIFVTNLNENGNLNMTHKTKSGVTSELILNGTNGTLTSDYPLLASFKDTDIYDGNASTYFSGQMMDGAKSGSYTGTMTYSVYCNKY